MGLFLPRRWRSQPQYPVRLSRNPYPTWVLSPSVRIEPVTGKQYVLGATASIVPGPQGYQLKGSGTASGVSFVQYAGPPYAGFFNYNARDFSGNSPDRTGPFYVFFRVYLSETADQVLFGDADSGGNNWWILLRVLTGAWQLDTRGYSCTTSGGTVTTGWHDVEIWSPNGASGYTQYLAVDGVDIGNTVSATPFPASTHAFQMAVGQWGSLVYRNFTGTIPLAFGLNTVPSPGLRQQYRQNPWGELFAPLPARRFFLGAAAGAATHPSTGVLTGAGSTVAGTATHLALHTTTGALTGPGSSVVGAAVHPHTTTGVLTGAGSTVAGTATHGAVHETTGTLTGPGSTVAGSALHPHTTAGVLTGSGSTVAGAAERASPGIHPTTGALVGAGSTVAGTAAHLGLHTTTGALVGPGASVSGTATRLALHTTSGILVAAGATVTGAATRVGAGAVAHDTDGALVGAGSTVSGAAVWYLSGVYGDPQLEKYVNASPDRIGLPPTPEAHLRVGRKPSGKPRRIG